MIRYPGSKDKIAREIIASFPSPVIDSLFQSKQMEYREPFFGGGAIGFRVLCSLPEWSRLWLNDKDFGIACLWKALYDTPDELIEQVKAFRPSVDAFYEFKEFDGTTDRDPILTGFRKFALHQMSFSGNGAMAGGPIGGRSQRSEFNVGCRWNAIRHSSEIKKRSRLLRRFASVRITSGDFQRLVENAPEYAFIYADPPYYRAGPQLYKHSFTDEDHRRLAAALAGCKAAWVLSYDDHDFIRGLYPSSQIRSVELTYTTAVSKKPRRKNSELIIRPKPAARLEAVA